MFPLLRASLRAISGADPPPFRALVSLGAGVPCVRARPGWAGPIAATPCFAWTALSTSTATATTATSAAIATAQRGGRKTAKCCIGVRGVACKSGGLYRVSEAQLERTVAAKRSNNQGKLSYDPDVFHGGRCWVCAEHSYDVIKAHLKETYEVSNAKVTMDRRDLIKEVLWCTGTHEDQDQDQAEKLAAQASSSSTIASRSTSSSSSATRRPRNWSA